MEDGKIIAKKQNSFKRLIINLQLSQTHSLDQEELPDKPVNGRPSV